MVQPINNPTGRVLTQGDPPAISGERPGASSGTARPGTGDTVDLSLRARAMPAALQIGPPKDTARVDSLRAAIAEGSYRPDPDRIADSLARNILETAF
ncbi:MAG: flagellar biosynthesis anti-sigma factor FlgM [Gemmobacter sp.]|nr:flagellar biosynthesis anti-sigma factor FlgM [Gemmobacter sp.]